MVSKSQIKKGIKEEFEHTTNRRLARKIAMDHLKKNPTYYTKVKGCLKNKRSTLRGSGGLLSNPKGLLGNKY